MSTATQYRAEVSRREVGEWHRELRFLLGKSIKRRHERIRIRQLRELLAAHAKF